MLLVVKLASIPAILSLSNSHLLENYYIYMDVKRRLCLLHAFCYQVIVLSALNVLPPRVVLALAVRK